MDDEDYQEPHADASDDPAAAFERLRGEVALLRHAVEGLASVRASIEIPDYQPTLERTEKALGVLAQQMEGVRKSPAMTLTPEALGQRVNVAVANVTGELRNSVSSAKSALDGAARDLSGLVASARRGDEQNKWLYLFGGGGVLLGFLLYVLLAGPFARMMPESWQWPERIATRTLGVASQWEAGQRLMQTAAPESWALIVAASPLSDGNRETVQGCRERAARAKEPVRCTIEVKPDHAR